MVELGKGGRVGIGGQPFPCLPDDCPGFSAGCISLVSAIRERLCLLLQVVGGARRVYDVGPVYDLLDNADVVLQPCLAYEGGVFEVPPAMWSASLVLT